ncbi:MAG: hypothetical protein HQ501_02340 [Rhodospirillales bacterium]|nr:hypothetical protein [Rhodospirillales bacterium]
MDNLKPHSRTCSLPALFLFAFAVFLIKPASAELPVVLQNLQNTPATLFDIGMKQLRRQALNGAVRLSFKSGPSPTSRVWMSKDTGTIEILYLYSVESDAIIAPTAQFCARIRAAALKEIFQIGLTAYDIELSDEARIARRLGSYFSSEPARGSKDSIAMGQRLSELTYLEVQITDNELNKTVTCRGSVNKLHPE